MTPTEFDDQLKPTCVLTLNLEQAMRADHPAMKLAELLVKIDDEIQVGLTPGIGE